MQNETILIFGATGMLGRELLSACNARGLHVAGLGGRGRVNITDLRAVQDAVSAHRPTMILNAAAFTNVDAAEENPQEAMRVNGAGPGNLAQAAAEHGVLLVDYSTDYIFSGRSRRPLREDDPPDPLNVYGASKLEGERRVIDSGCDHLIIRTSWLFAPHGRNFVRTIHAAASAQSELKVVDDQVGRPTYAPDLAEMTLHLLEKNVRGVIHAANDGSCSRYELARAIVEMSGLSCRVLPCDSSVHPRPALRPAWSVLDLSRLEAMGIQLRPWREALGDCLVRMQRESAA